MGGLDLLVFTTGGVGLFAWTFRYVFDNAFIRTYSVRSKIHKDQINQITDNLNKRYYCSIKPVDIDQDSVNHSNSHDRDFLSAAKLDASLVASLVVRSVFGLTVTLSLQLMMLIMVELASDSSGSRAPYFHFTIDSLVILVSLIVPWIVSSLVVSQDLYPKTPSRTGVTLVVYGIWFLLLYKCGDLSQSFAPDSSSYKTRSLLDKKINQISIVGITVIAVLSGIGSSSTIYKQWPVWNRYFKRVLKKTVSSPPTVSENDINSLVSAYNNTTLLIKKREAELNDILVSTGGKVYNQPQRMSSSDNVLSFNGSKKFGGIIHKVQSFASLSNLSLGRGNSEEKELRDEIHNLVNLQESVYGDLSKQVSRYIAIKDQDSHWSHKLINWFNIGFSIYCVYRIFNVFLIKLPYYYLFSSDAQVVEETEATKDALAITVASLIKSVTRSSISETILVNQISFVLSGSLFLCSFSNVLVTLRSVGNMLPIISFSSKTKSWLKHLAISQLLAVYVIATCLLIRSNLPYNLSVQISKILSLSGSSTSSSTAIKEVQFIDHWFDVIYALSTAITFLALVIKAAADSDNQFDDYDEETVIEDVNFKTL